MLRTVAAGSTRYINGGVYVSEWIAWFSCWEQGLSMLGVDEEGAVFFVGANNDGWNKREA